MKQHQCARINNVINTISQIANRNIVDEEKKYLRELCNKLKKSKTEASITIDYEYFTKGNIAIEKDCSLFIGYDKNNNCYYVGIDFIDESEEFK